MKAGIGYDIHRLVAGRKLLLGGVHIPYPKGLKGHSDGDALLHAIVDAALGAMGEGDIGEHFSDSDPKYRNADSALFAMKVIKLLKQNKLKISSIDSTIIAEAPKLSGYKEKIRNSVAKIFSVPASKVNVKAKTNEGLGEIGQKKAIACFAVVALI
jgi:2-C-methyl-D-erythritol 2,4-cyclodiphosphate synthase